MFDPGVLTLMSRQSMLHMPHGARQRAHENAVGETIYASVVSRYIVEFDGLLVLFEIGGSVGARRDKARGGELRLDFEVSRASRVGKGGFRKLRV